MKRQQLIGSCFAVLALAGCGGGDGPPRPSGPTDDVPSSNDPPAIRTDPPLPSGEPTPNSSDRAPNSSDPPGGAPETPGQDPLCTRLCDGLVALDCEVADDLGVNCRVECLSSLGDECGRELGAVYQCVLDRGYCPDALATELGPGGALAACVPAVDALGSCEDPPDPDPDDDGDPGP